MEVGRKNYFKPIAIFFTTLIIVETLIEIYLRSW